MKLFLLSQGPFILKQTWISLTLVFMMYETKLMYTNQEIIKIDTISDWWGEKSTQTVRYIKRVLLRGQFLHGGLSAPPHKASLTLVMTIDRYLYPGAPSPPVSPWGSCSGADWDSNLCYTVSKFPFKCPWSGNTTEGRDPVSQSKHRCFFKFSALSLKAMRILHKHTQNQHLFQHTKIFSPLPRCSGKTYFILWILILFWHLLLTNLTLLHSQGRKNRSGWWVPVFTNGRNSAPASTWPYCVTQWTAKAAMVQFSAVALLLTLIEF